MQKSQNKVDRSAIAKKAWKKRKENEKFIKEALENIKRAKMVKRYFETTIMEKK